MMKDLDSRTHEERWRLKVNTVIAFLISIGKGTGVFCFILGGENWEGVKSSEKVWSGWKKKRSLFKKHTQKRTTKMISDLEIKKLEEEWWN